MQPLAAPLVALRCGQRLVEAPGDVWNVCIEIDERVLQSDLCMTMPTRNPIPCNFFIKLMHQVYFNLTIMEGFRCGNGREQCLHIVRACKPFSATETSHLHWRMQATEVRMTSSKSSLISRRRASDQSSLSSITDPRPCCLSTSGK
jgi:hypothetical protein